MINDFDIIKFFNTTGLIYLLIIIAFALIVNIGTRSRK